MGTSRPARHRGPVSKGRRQEAQGLFDFGASAPRAPAPGPPEVPRPPAEATDIVPPFPFAFAPSPAPEAAASPPVAVPGGPAAPKGAEPLSVAALGKLVERALLQRFAEPVTVVGEAVGVRAAQSGHLYFTLKDEEGDAALDVVVYRTNLTPRARAVVRDGAKVLLRGRPTYYSPRGRLQFVADRVGLSGKGTLLEALQKLKEKLAAEGLFRDDRKRALPREPRVVGVVTSKTGAVIHDICRVAFRRGGAHILLAPAQVQGAAAPAAICRALRELQRVPEVDVIIVGRGGGSADDLSAFNDEAVVRAVATCRVPVVSAVGHEVDVTLADFAADARASTPSQAAELVVPDGRAQARLLAERRGALVRAMRSRVGEARLALASTQRRLGDPRALVAVSQQRLDERRARAARAARRRVERAADDLRSLTRRLALRSPRVVLDAERAAVLAGASRLTAAAERALSARRTELARLASRLDAMSPLKVLGRGYAIVTTARGAAVRSAAEVRVGEPVLVRVADGTLEAEITAVPARKAPA